MKTSFIAARRHVNRKSGFATRERVAQGLEDGRFAVDFG